MFGSDWNGVGGLLGVFGIFGKAKHDIKCSIEDEEKRRQSIDSGRNTYFDRRGIERNIKTKNKIYHTHDSDGYAIIVDAKTKEILDDSNRREFEEKKENAKARAKRAGHDVYTYQTMKLNKYNAPIKVKEYRRVSDDKIVMSNKGYVTPRFKLRCTGKDNLNIRHNRKAVYEYCYKWYVDDNRQGDYPTEIMKEAEEYGVTVFEKDIEYCLNRISMAIKDDSVIAFSSMFFPDVDYAHADWVEKEYWI